MHLIWNGMCLLCRLHLIDYTDICNWFVKVSCMYLVCVRVAFTWFCPAAVASVTCRSVFEGCFVENIDLLCLYGYTEKCASCHSSNKPGLHMIIDTQQYGYFTGTTKHNKLSLPFKFLCSFHNSVSHKQMKIYYYIFIIIYELSCRPAYGDENTHL